MQKLLSKFFVDNQISFDADIMNIAHKLKEIDYFESIKINISKKHCYFFFNSFKNKKNSACFL